MKITLGDRESITSEEGHQVRELVGMATMNVSKFSVAHIVATAGSEGVTRKNQFDEILLVITGHGTVEQDFVTHELSPTDLLLIPSGTGYAIHAGAGGDLELWAICVPAYRPEWSGTASTKRDWRDYQVPRGADRLRELRDRQQNK